MLSTTIKSLFNKVHVLSEKTDDQLCIERIQAGDIQAFDELVDRYKHRLFSVIYNITSHKEDTADLLQETFIKAFQAIGRFKPSASFFTWIYRIALNQTISHLRRKKNHYALSLQPIDDENISIEIQEKLIDPTQHSHEKITAHELQDELNLALQTLPIDQRTAIILSEIEGLGSAEIARIMKCSEGTVRSRIHYGKKHLQALLKDYLR